MANPNPANITIKKLIDSPAAEISAALEANVSWITKAYNKIEVKEDNRGRFPVVFTGRKSNKGYLNLMPDSKLGNFSFIEIGEKQKIKQFAGSIESTYDISIIFFFNFSDVYGVDANERTIENVKDEILTFFRRYPFATCNIRINEVVEGAKNVYSNYSHREIRNQFNMRPYGCFKISGELKAIDNCEDSILPIAVLPKDGLSYSDLKDTPESLEAGKYPKVKDDGSGIEFVDSAGGGVTTHSALTLDDGANPHNTNPEDIAAAGLSDDYLAAYILAKNT